MAKSKMLYVFIGETGTGKTILSHFIDKSNVRLIDGFVCSEESVKELIDKLMIDIKHTILFTQNYNENELLDKLNMLKEYYLISICNMKRL